MRLDLGVLVSYTLLIAAVGCSHAATVVQAGTPAAPPSAAPDSTAASEPAPFWSDTIRPWKSLSRGWNRVQGRFGTGCAHDTIYAFKVRPGLTDKVMIFLNGGGMCWRSATCDPKHPAVVMSADSPANDVSVRAGVLDYDNERNPLRDWTMVFVSYCTGDAHLGSSDVEYVEPGAKDDAKTFHIRHGGAANLEAVLDWVFVNLKRPTTILVAGSDAGAVASPVVAARVARHYPRARVVQLGDGAGSYRSDSIPAMMGIWGATDYLLHDPTYRSLDSADLDFQHLYLAAARAFPRIQFAQVNQVDDATQLAFLATLGSRETSLAKPLRQDFDELRTDVSSFATYTAPGKGHALLRSNSIYTLKVDGKPFIDWLEALVNDDPVSDVGDKLLSPVPKPGRAPERHAPTPGSRARSRASR